MLRQRASRSRPCRRSRFDSAATARRLRSRILRTSTFQLVDDYRGQLGGSMTFACGPHCRTQETTGIRFVQVKLRRRRPAATRVSSCVGCQTRPATRAAFSAVNSTITRRASAVSAYVDAEGAVENLLDLEVHRDLKRALAKTLSFDESLDRLDSHVSGEKCRRQPARYAPFFNSPFLFATSSQCEISGDGEYRDTRARASNLRRYDDCTQCGAFDSRFRRPP